MFLEFLIKASNPKLKKALFKENMGLKSKMLSMINLSKKISKLMLKNMQGILPNK